jgi:L-fuconolactonase
VVLQDRIPIIDTHVHVWDLKRLDLPWLGPPLDRSYLAADYLAGAEGLNVVGAVYVEVGAGAGQRWREAEQAVELCQRADNPIQAAVIGGDVASEAFIDRLSAYAGGPVRGVRQGVPEEPGGSFVEGLWKLAELGMHFELNSDLSRGLRLLDACPAVRFVLNHCGGGRLDMADLGRWRREIGEVSQRPNVFCKLSGVVNSISPGGSVSEVKPIVERVIECFGIDRVMFGGDWPICTLSVSLGQWTAGLWELLGGLSEGERRRVFHDNAVRFYQLNGKES